MNPKSIECFWTSRHNQGQEGHMLKPNIKYKVTLTEEEREFLR